MRTISILNFKGGVGKSTLAINLGHALAMGGVSVLVVDCDLQANASTLLPERRTPTLTDVLMGRASLVDAIHPARENLRIVPADGNLDEAAKRVAAADCAATTWYVKRWRRCAASMWCSSTTRRRTPP